MYMLCVVLVLFCADVGLSNDIDILSFTQSAPSVRPGESVSFDCQVNADSAHWRINGFSRFSSNPSAGYTIANSEDGNRDPRFILSLTMQGDQFNHTRVSCFASSTATTGHYIILDKYFIIANLHSGPELDVTVDNTGNSLTISWEEPFAHSPFNITGYTLVMENTTSGHKETLLEDTTELSHVIQSPDNTEGCHWLNFTIEAHSDLGSVSAHKLTVFPKALVPITLDVEFSYVYNDTERTPRLLIRATFSDPCSFEDTEYTLSVVDLTTPNMTFDLEFSRQLFPPFTMEMVVAEGLVVDRSYNITATGSNIVGTFSTSKTQHIIPLNMNNNGCDRNLSSPIAGSVRIIETELGVLAVYTCDDASTVPPSRTCHSNGVWSGEKPYCPYVNCDRDLPNPTNGSVSILRGPLGDLVAAYTCDDGREVNRSCLANDSWADHPPVCYVPPTATVTVVIYDNQLQYLVYILVPLLSVLGLVILCVCVILATVSGLLYRKQRKTRAIRRRIPPSSITLSNPLNNKSATNPIYEGAGPMYDTPNEPMKSLLHNTSTPSTPSISSPRYFHMPPQLPPPRKGSISAPFPPTSTCAQRVSFSTPFSPGTPSAQRVSISSPLPPSSFDEHGALVSSPTNCSSQAQVEKIQASFNAEVPASEDAYTTMNPIRPRSLSRPNKPSPLVIPNSIRLEGNDEYVSVL